MIAGILFLIAISGCVVFMLTKFSNNDQLLSQVFHGSRTAMVIVDTSGVIHAMNSVMTNMTKLPLEDVVGKLHWSVFIPPADVPQAEEFFNQLLQEEGGPCTIQADMLTKDAEKLPMNWEFSVLRDHQGAIEFVVMMGHELSDDLFQGQYSVMCDQILEAMYPVMITDANAEILKVNRAFTEITGYKAVEVIGKNPHILSSGLYGEAFYHQLWQSLLQQGQWSGELTNRHKDGHTFTESARIQAVYDDRQQVRYFVASFSDISEFKKNENELKFLSRFDKDTGLVNRAHFLRQLDWVQQKCQQKGLKGLLFYVRLERLEKLNINHGRTFTDSTILNLVNYIEQSISDYHYLLGRISGSGFGVCLYDLAETDIDLVIRNIIDQFQHLSSNCLLTLDEGEKHFDIGSKLGICDFPNTQAQSLTPADILLDHAILASHKANDSIEAYEVYSESLQKTMDNAHELDVALSHALHDLDQFELYHQPQFNHHGEMVGGEALIRWHLEGEFISPAEFIPLAEKSKAIVKISHWVIKQAVDHLKTLNDEGLIDCYPLYSVNFSPRCIMDNKLIDFLEEQVANFPEVAQHIKIEITETAFINEFERFKKRLDRVKSLGFKISIDDFGTGYSSLSYLSELDFDELKIDKTFVDKLNSQSDDSSRIIKAITGMAKVLNVKVVAEGIETQQQFEQLKQLECDIFQGYWFSKPLPFGALLNLIKSNQSSVDYQ